MALAATADDASAPARPVCVVGFADLVAFTQMSRELDELELAKVVERFEEITSDVVAASGGRLVKTLGDEVLFSAESPELGAEISLAIAEAIKKSPDVPDVRVGVSYGPVLPLMGDVFGTTVNLAARLTAIARPGSVVADAALAAELAESTGYEAIRILRRPARGLGVVQPYVLRRRPG
jgi:adenylate cyclase